jgi:hypothetical protein
MVDVNELKSIKTNLIHELIEVSKKDGQLQTMDTLAHAIKNICKIIESCEEEEMNYSEYSGYRIPRYSGYMMEPMYSGNDYSGARRRDSMGRYSSHGDLKTSLYEAMNHATNDMERQQIQDLINRLG